MMIFLQDIKDIHCLSFSAWQQIHIISAYSIILACHAANHTNFIRFLSVATNVWKHEFRLAITSTINIKATLFVSIDWYPVQICKVWPLRKILLSFSFFQDQVNTLKLATKNKTLNCTESCWKCSHKKILILNFLKLHYSNS